MLQYGAAESFQALVHSFVLFPPDPTEGTFVAPILGGKFWLSICNKVYFVGEYEYFCILLIVYDRFTNSVTGISTPLRGL